MLIGAAVLKASPPLMTLNGIAIDSVAAFKLLLVVHTANDLEWRNHVEDKSRVEAVFLKAA